METIFDIIFIVTFSVVMEYIVIKGINGTK